MKHLKKFEELDFNQTILQTSVSELTNYYKCECNSLFKLFNKVSKCCPFCNSRNISSIGFDRFYSEVSKRLQDDEQEDLDFVKSQEEEVYANLDMLKTRKFEGVDSNDKSSH